MTFQSTRRKPCDSAVISSVRSIALFVAAAGRQSRSKDVNARWAFAASKIRIIPRIRELRSNGEMRKLLNRKITAQNGICGICKEKFTDYSDVVPDHISPRGMGGAWRDDHPDNIQAVHWWCNGEKGSSRG